MSPEMVIPAACQSCGILFDAKLVGGNPAKVVVHNSKASCPRCGKMAPIANGTFTSDDLGSIRYDISFPFAVPAAAIITLILSNQGVPISEVQKRAKQAIERAKADSDDGGEDLREWFLESFPPAFRSKIAGFLPENKRQFIIVLMMLVGIIFGLGEAGSMNPLRKQLSDPGDEAVPDAIKQHIDANKAAIQKYIESTFDASITTPSNEPPIEDEPVSGPAINKP